MKIIRPRIVGALVSLGVLLVIVPNARSDDATDWANQQAQAQRDREQAEQDRQDRENWQNQIAQAQKEREDWYNQQAQAQKEREAWDNQQAQAQRDREQAERDRQDRENWAAEQANARQEAINNGEWGAPAAARPAAVPPNQPAAGPGAAPALSAPPPPQPGAKQPKTYTVTIDHGGQVTRTTFVMGDDGSWHPTEGLGIDTVTPAALVAGPMAAPQVRFPAQAIPQQAPMPFDPVAFQQMVRQNQERVRQQILQTRQQMMQRNSR